MSRLKRIMAGAAAVTLLAFSACAGNKAETADAPDASASETAETREVDYNERVERTVTLFKFDGVVYITKNGQLVAQSATGKLDSDEDSADITIDTQFCICSLSKQFTSAAIMLLKEQGKLSVDDTLDVYFPDYVIGMDITIEDLLTMRSGIPDHYSYITDRTYDEYEYEEYTLPFAVYSESDAYDNKLAIENWIFNQPLDFEPETSFGYSNSNYLLLSEIVEQVSGTEYNSFIRQNIFEPLGMTSTCFINDDEAASLALSYSPTYEALYPGVMQGSGDIISTAKDMDKWLTALRENKIISAESFAEMTADHCEELDGAPEYGYGLMATNDGIGHTGSIASYGTYDYINVDNGYNLFIATNNSQAIFGDITEFASMLIDRTSK